jgi:hypothetical protein
MQSKLELLSHNPGLLLHVLCKQVQAMAWVERLLQVTAAAFAHPTRGALAQLPSPQIKPVLLAAAAVPPSLAGGGGSTQGKDPLSLPDFQAMVRRAAEPVWSQTLDPAGTSSAAAAAAAVRVLSAARDAILLEHSTARASWQTDLTCRYVRTGNREEHATAAVFFRPAAAKASCCSQEKCRNAASSLALQVEELACEPAWGLLAPYFWLPVQEVSEGSVA